MDDPVLVAILSSVLTALCTFLGTLYAAVHPWRKKYDVLAQKHEALVRTLTYRKDHDYDVALDGIKSAGKSALIARWMNPTTDVDLLGATSGIALHRPIQVGAHEFESADGKRYTHRYRLVIHDVGGEFRSQLGQVLIEKKIRAAILVIDPMELEASLERFSGGTLHMTYLTKNALDHLICLLIYISKCDIASEDQLRTAERQVHERLVRVLEHRFAAKHNLLVFRGSATTGEGIFKAQAFLAEQLGFAQYLEKHKSLTKVSR